MHSQNEWELLNLKLQFLTSWYLDEGLLKQWGKHYHISKLQVETNVALPDARHGRCQDPPALPSETEVDCLLPCFCDLINFREQISVPASTLILGRCSAIIRATISLGAGAEIELPGKVECSTIGFMWCSVWWEYFGENRTYTSAQ